MVEISDKLGKIAYGLKQDLCEYFAFALWCSVHVSLWKRTMCFFKWDGRNLDKSRLIQNRKRSFIWVKTEKEKQESQKWTKRRLG